jgi:hypothetical protein
MQATATAEIALPIARKINKAGGKQVAPVACEASGDGESLAPRPFPLVQRLNAAAAAMVRRRRGCQIIGISPGGKAQNMS